MSDVIDKRIKFWSKYRKNLWCPHWKLDSPEAANIYEPRSIPFSPKDDMGNDRGPYIISMTKPETTFANPNMEWDNPSLYEFLDTWEFRLR